MTEIDLDPPYDLSKVLIIAPFGLQVDYVKEREEMQMEMLFHF